MIAVIADDISGAAELANAALRHGLSAEVQTEFDPRTEADVICIDTDTRSLSAPEAARAAGAVAREVAEANPAWIYKKCDSVLRGPVRAETEAIMAAAGRSRAVLISANPSRGRVIRGGLFFVGDQLLHETAFARDPEHPRTTSHVVELLGGVGDGITVPDAATKGDLDRAAAGIDATVLAGGGADFFEALLAQHGFLPTARIARSSAGPEDGSALTLLICGSAAAWRKRWQEARAHGIPAFSLPHDLTKIAAGCASNRSVLIGIGEGPAVSGPAPAVLVRQLARTGGEILRRIPVRRVLLEGGATAAVILRELGWTRLSACELAAPGIGTLRPLETKGPILSIKPGSYDWPAELWP